MQIEDFKRWHWVLIALVIGSLMAFSWNMTSPDEKADGRGTSAFEYLGNIIRQKTGNGDVWVRQTLIYPPQDKIDGTTGKIGKANYVVCSMLTPMPDGKYKYLVKHFTADIPFKVGNIPPKSDTYSIRDYLDENKKTFPETVEYRYAWWATHNAQYVLWMGGSVLLIGGVWPSLVGLMTGAGLGRPKREKSEEYDISRFGKSVTSAKNPDPVKVGMSSADSDQLRNVQEQLERNVSGMQMTNGEPASAGGSATSGLTSAQVKTLSGTSEPLAPAKPVDDGKPKEYGGEYYPVAKTGVHVDQAEETKKR
jgi:hypothetical protein